MNEEVNNTSAAFMEVSFKKIESQEKRIAAVEEKINNMPDNTQLFQNVISSIEGLRTDVNNNRFPIQKMEELTREVDSGLSTYKELVKNKIVHHHHVPKMIWITAGLFIAFALVCAGWYSTSTKLDGYIANDTKYRQLRLDTANRSLQSYLDLMDSLYQTQSDMRKIVFEKEEKNRENFERLERAERLRAEAKDLEKAAKKK